VAGKHKRHESTQHGEISKTDSSKKQKICLSMTSSPGKVFLSYPAKQEAIALTGFLVHPFIHSLIVSVDKKILYLEDKMCSV
jgi:hypothetical protein